MPIRSGTTRRKLLALMGMAPVAGPAAAKMVAEKAMAELAGVSIAPSVTGGLGMLGNSGSTANPNVQAQRVADPRLAARLALKVPHLRAELESLLYEQNRSISYFDPDIANKRSFSFAAKVAFQRQRIVDRELTQSGLLGGTAWERMNDWMQRAVKMFGTGTG